MAIPVPRFVSNQTAPISAKTATRLASIAIPAAPTAANSQGVASERHCNYRMGKLPNGFVRGPLYHQQRGTLSFLLNLISCLCLLRGVCNFYLGYLKVAYRVACPTPRGQHAKTELCGQKFNQLLLLRAVKLSAIAANSERVLERACHGLKKRWIFWSDSG
ncbi:hypothetical protein BDV12DRAFT_34876 [Aspergillus spectabilis]